MAEDVNKPVMDAKPPPVPQSVEEARRDVLTFVVHAPDCDLLQRGIVYGGMCDCRLSEALAAFERAVTEAARDRP